MRTSIRIIWKVLPLLIFCMTATNILAQTWATAISRNGDRAIIFRYIQELGPHSQRHSQKDRVIIVWKYKSESGMPSKGERERMDSLEDLLHPKVEKNGFATLALVSTGENLREWIYYTKSQEEFLNRLNKALREQAPYPIEIHTAADPEWSSYERFKAGVRQ